MFLVPGHSHLEQNKCSFILFEVRTLVLNQQLWFPDVGPQEQSIFLSLEELVGLVSGTNMRSLFPSIWPASSVEYWCVLHGSQLSLVWLMVLVFIVRWCRILLNTLLVCLQTVSLKEFILFDCFESLLVSGHSLFYVFRPLKSCLFDNLLLVFPTPSPQLDIPPISNLKKGETCPEKQIICYIS